MSNVTFDLEKLRDFVEDIFEVHNGCGNEVYTQYVINELGHLVAIKNISDRNGQRKRWELVLKGEMNDG